MNPIDDFTFVNKPDFQKISDLMLATWDIPCVEYTPKVLKMYLELPTADPELVLAQASEDGTYASVQALVPYVINYKGQNFKAAFGSFLTIRRDSHSAQLLIPQLLELLGRAEVKEYDIFFEIRETRPDDGVFDLLIERFFKRRGMVIKKINTFRYLLGVKQILEAKLSPIVSGDVRLMTNSDLPVVKNIVQNYTPNVDLYKKINISNVEYLFLNREFSSTYLYEKNEKIISIINLIELHVLETDKKILNLYIENMIIEQLSDEEQLIFLSSVLRKMMERLDFTAVFIPDTAYFSKELFKKIFFRRSPRELNLYMGAFKKTAEVLDIESIDSSFIDVY